MNWPDQEHAQRLLEKACLTGAEADVLYEYLSLPVSDWQHYADEERVTWATDAPEDEEEPDTQEEDYAEKFPTTSMIRRVNQILQNHHFS